MKSSALLFSMLLGAYAVVWVARAAPNPTETPAKLKGKIAFQSNRNTPAEIYVMNADGTNQSRLGSQGSEYHPSWAPGFVPDPTLKKTGARL